MMGGVKVDFNGAPPPPPPRRRPPPPPASPCMLLTGWAELAAGDADLRQLLGEHAGARAREVFPPRGVAKLCLPTRSG